MLLLETFYQRTWIGPVQALWFYQAQRGKRRNNVQRKKRACSWHVQHEVIAWSLWRPRCWRSLFENWCLIRAGFVLCRSPWKGQSVWHTGINSLAFCDHKKPIYTGHRSLLLFWKMRQKQFRIEPKKKANQCFVCLCVCVCGFFLFFFLVHKKNLSSKTSLGTIKTSRNISPKKSMQWLQRVSRNVKCYDTTMQIALSRGILGKTRLLLVLNEAHLNTFCWKSPGKEELGSLIMLSAVFCYFWQACRVGSFHAFCVYTAKLVYHDERNFNPVLLTALLSHKNMSNKKCHQTQKPHWSILRC